MLKLLNMVSRMRKSSRFDPQAQSFCALMNYGLGQREVGDNSFQVLQRDIGLAGGSRKEEKGRCFFLSALYKSYRWYF